MRWFRGTARKDIQHELAVEAGWPAGPEFTRRPRAPRQRRYVESYASSVTDRDPALPPVVTRRPSGRFLIEVRTTKPVSAEHGIETDHWHMSKRGRRGALRQGDI